MPPPVYAVFATTWKEGVNPKGEPTRWLHSHQRYGPFATPQAAADYAAKFPEHHSLATRQPLLEAQVKAEKVYATAADCPTAPC